MSGEAASSGGRGDAARGTSTTEAFWKRLSLLVAAAPTVETLRAHRLHLIAPSAWPAAGRIPPAELEDELRGSAMISVIATSVLARAVEVTDAPLILFKGAEAGARWIDPRWRAYGDIDLISPDPEGVQASLLAGGFVPAGGGDDDYYVELHHLRPLILPGLPITLEVHRRPPWPEWLPEPDASAIFARARRSYVHVDGLLAPDPADHALLVAAHAWDYAPLGRAVDLVDVFLLANEAGRSNVLERARELGIERLWQTTIGAADVLFGDSPRRLPWWARNLSTLNDVTVLGHHVQRWLSPFSVMKPLPAVRAAAVNIARDAMPAGGGESWANKAARSRRALRNAFRRKWHHERELGDDARRPPRRDRY